MKKGIIIAVMSIIIIISIWWKIFIPTFTPKKEKISSQVLIQYQEEKDSNETEKFNKKYSVLRGFDDDVSFRGFPRYTRKISVNLGLSRKELIDNLIHAAWELQKEKSATAVMIFAYRKDDIKKDMYSAGRCTLAPFGDWSEATNKYSNSISNLKPVVDIAEVYFKDISPMYKVKTNVIVNTDNTDLYKDKDLGTENIILKLKKGTEAIVVDGERIFSTDEFLDIYKIRFYIGKNKTTAGWVFGDRLDESLNTISITQSAPQKQAPQNQKERYNGIHLYNKTIADWKKAKTEDKIITCEAFILVLLSENYFKIKMINIENIRDYAEILAGSIDTISKDSRKFDNMNVTEMMAVAARELGWI